MHRDLAGSIETVLKAYVLPDLLSTHPMLQSRACWVYGEFNDSVYLQDVEHVKAAV